MEKNLENKGVSILVESEKQYNELKSVMGEKLYVDFVPQMLTVRTSVVIYVKEGTVSNYSVGSVGSEEYQLMSGFHIVEQSKERDTNRDIIIDFLRWMPDNIDDIFELHDNPQSVVDKYLDK